MKWVSRPLALSFIACPSFLPLLCLLVYPCMSSQLHTSASTAKSCSHHSDFLTRQTLTFWTENQSNPTFIKLFVGRYVAKTEREATQKPISPAPQSTFQEQMKKATITWKSTEQWLPNPLQQILEPRSWAGVPAPGIHPTLHVPSRWVPPMR